MSVMGWTALALLTPAAIWIVLFIVVRLIELLRDDLGRTLLFGWFMVLSTLLGLILGVGAIVTRGN